MQILISLYCIVMNTPFELNTLMSSEIKAQTVMSVIAPTTYLLSRNDTILILTEIHHN